MESKAKTILPGQWIGILGGGQLGRMSAQAAQRLGYHVCVLSPEGEGPAAQVADRHLTAEYTDEQALGRLASGVEVVTVEFENIPSSALEWLSERVPVRPSSEVLHTAQHRLREKQRLASHGFPLAGFAPVQSETDLREALGRLGHNGVLKTAGFGYDGKGQRRIRPGDDPSEAWASMGGQPSVFEAWVTFVQEISVVAARSVHGQVRAFPVFENIHHQHILDYTLCPARISPELSNRAVALASEIIEALDGVGLLTIEMFVLPSGEILVNELAPRPHNSGHLTLDACVTSQFEQHVRAVTGLPLGEVHLRKPSVMANLLGDVWQQGMPHWERLLEMPDAHLHLYGKAEAKPGRKMGHLTVLDESLENAIRGAQAARERLAGLSLGTSLEELLAPQ